MLGFEFQLVYRLGRKNHEIDALSKRKDSEILEAISGTSWELWDEIRERIKNDLRYKEVMKKLDTNAKRVENYEMGDELLKYKRRVVVLSVGILLRRF